MLRLDGPWLARSRLPAPSRPRPRPVRRHRLHRSAHRGVPRAPRRPPDCAGPWPGATRRSSSWYARAWATIDPALADAAAARGRPGDRPSLAHGRERPRWSSPRSGPYLEYGEPLVAACAAAGTDYVDLTGEPEFVDRMYLAHHEQAQSSGARIVHACGFDSIPHDLGAYYTVKELAARGPVAVRGVVRAGARSPAAPSTPRWAPSRRARQMREAMLARRKVEPRPEGRSSTAVAGKPHRDGGAGPLAAAAADDRPVRGGAQRRRAGVLRAASSATPTTPAPRPCATPSAGAAGAGRHRRLRPGPAAAEACSSRIKQGEGPDEARRAKSWFTVDFVGEGDGRTVHTRVSGGDPGYGETAKMLAESALCLAFDDNPTTAGSVTTAQAMGDNLTARLMAAGIRFETVEARRGLSGRWRPRGARPGPDCRRAAARWSSCLPACSPPRYHAERRPTRRPGLRSSRGCGGWARSTSRCRIWRRRSPTSHRRRAGHGDRRLQRVGRRLVPDEAAGLVVSNDFLAFPAVIARASVVNGSTTCRRRPRRRDLRAGRRRPRPRPAHLRRGLLLGRRPGVPRLGLVARRPPGRCRARPGDRRPRAGRGPQAAARRLHLHRVRGTTTVAATCG